MGALEPAGVRAPVRTGLQKGRGKNIVSLKKNLSLYIYSPPLRTVCFRSPRPQHKQQAKLPSILSHPQALSAVEAGQGGKQAGY
jgi:hypothetical protein